MASFPYSPLSPGGDNIRLLRLLPNEDEAAPLQCKLCNYSLRKSNPRTQLYEALSYVWGNPHETLPIYVDNDQFPVTLNLHAALLRLRDHSLERIIWIDAVCINQKILEEQGQQVQLMAKIYSNAHRVIVWLGEMADDIDGALENICLAANREYIEHSKKKIILNLLQRSWFQRIWVLQEVAAARHVVIMCGPIEISGYAFCLGLKSLELPYTASPKLQSVPSLIYLIERAGLRYKYTKRSLERISLETGHLVELVDMFHTREASDLRDKVYALLGMSSDDLDKAGLQPDYSVPWSKLFRKLVKFILYKDISVETFDDSQMAVIKSKGCILGRVSSVTSDNRQNITITFISKSTAWRLGERIEWILRASAKYIRKGDIVCFLQKSSKPTIIRQCRDYFVIVVIAATPLNKSGSSQLLELSESRVHFSRDFLLVWDWEKPL
ncbi:heterokaryon incompatibility protein-domain-containing protein, partial [Tricladium varicosporioides]